MNKSLPEIGTKLLQLVVWIIVAGIGSLIVAIIVWVIGLAFGAKVPTMAIFLVIWCFSLIIWILWIFIPYAWNIKQASLIAKKMETPFVAAYMALIKHGIGMMANSVDYHATILYYNMQRTYSQGGWRINGEMDIYLPAKTYKGKDSQAQLEALGFKILAKSSTFYHVNMPKGWEFVFSLEGNFLVNLKEISGGKDGRRVAEIYYSDIETAISINFLD